MVRTIAEPNDVGQNSPERVTSLGRYVERLLQDGHEWPDRVRRRSVDEPLRQGNGVGHVRGIGPTDVCGIGPANVCGIGPADVCGIRPANVRRIRPAEVGLRVEWLESSVVVRRNGRR